jgi:hypothetical protein
VGRHQFKVRSLDAVTWQVLSETRHVWYQASSEANFEGGCIFEKTYDTLAARGVRIRSRIQSS